MTFPRLDSTEKSAAAVGAAFLLQFIGWNCYALSTANARISHHSLVPVYFLCGVGYAPGPDRPLIGALGLLLLIISSAGLLWAGWQHSRNKGYTGALGLAVALGIWGILVLFGLPRRRPDVASQDEYAPSSLADG